MEQIRNKFQQDMDLIQYLRRPGSAPLVQGFLKEFGQVCWVGSSREYSQEEDLDKGVL
jgi:hypothetical protein